MLGTYILTSIAIEAGNNHLSSSYVLLFGKKGGGITIQIQEFESSALNTCH